MNVLIDILHSADGYRQVNSPVLIESVEEHIYTPPIPARYHFLCRLALLSIQYQPP